VLNNKSLLAKNEDGRTAWYWAAHTGSVAALEILWSWAKEAELNTYELKKKLLLAQDKQWDIAWQVAVYTEHVDALEKLWVWAKQQQLNLIELKNELLLTLDKLEKPPGNLKLMQVMSMSMTLC